MSNGKSNGLNQGFREEEGDEYDYAHENTDGYPYVEDGYYDQEGGTEEDTV